MKYVYVFIVIKDKSEKRHIGFTIQMVIQINVCQSPLKIVLLMVWIIFVCIYLYVCFCVPRHIVQPKVWN